MLLRNIGIIGQIGHCMGGNFNIHIWAWSASPSVQVGRLQKSQTQSSYSAVTYLQLEISYLYFVSTSELDKVVFHSYFLTESFNCIS